MSSSYFAIESIRELVKKFIIEQQPTLANLSSDVNDLDPDVKNLTDIKQELNDAGIALDDLAMVLFGVNSDDIAFESSTEEFYNTKK